MPKQDNKKLSGSFGQSAPSTTSVEMAGELYSLSGRDALNRITEMDDPGLFIRNMAHVDLFWLVKKIGEDDSISLLKLASPEQWQYLMDMELWRRDRLSPDQTFNWLQRFQRADPVRLVRWLFGDGEFLACHYFFKNVRVAIKEDDDDDFDPPEDSFSLDGIFYIHITDKEQEEFIQNILRRMAREDSDRYQSFLNGLAGVLPNDIEEEMYRLRGMRLAEKGFLPFHEALSIYSHIEAGSLKKGEAGNELRFRPEEEIVALTPVTPLIHIRENNLLIKSLERLTDNILLDRVRLEFAGLCSQILSADGLEVDDIEVLIKASQKAGGYINLGLENLSGNNLVLCEQYLKNNPLISIFSLGFSLALELKWDAERWMKDSWFFLQGLGTDFWGNEWGGILSGILAKKPLLFSRLQEGEEYRDFERFSEIQDCRATLSRLIVLDLLFDSLSNRYSADKNMIENPSLTFHALLFNLWAHMKLDLEPRFETLSIEQTRDLFQLLRAGSHKPPYQMPGFGEIFVKDFMSYASDFNPDAAQLLKETLLLLWEEFLEEYSRVGTSQLDERFIKFILIHPSH